MIFEKIRNELQNKAFERYNNHGMGGEMVVALDDVVDTIHQVEAEYNNGWIPCSERLPETYGDYLCCDNYGEYIIGFPNKRDSNDDDYVEYYVETEHEIMNDCIAWQPLSKPYTPKGE